MYVIRIPIDSGTPDSSFSHPHWARVARGSELEIKSQLINGYPERQGFDAYHYPLFEPDARVPNLLDFGCGIGRNFSALKDVCDNLYAFDIPDMLTACRNYADCDGISILDSWDEVCTHRFDVIAATLVFQHIETPGLIETLLKHIAAICDFLYVSTRCWKDGPDFANIMGCIENTGLFTYEKGNLSLEDALAENHPSAHHYDAILRSKVSGYHRDHNARAFGLEAMHHQENHIRKDITVTQFFTPNYDHWAYTVLDNKRNYCDQHGYGFHYRRGLYPEAADRHPSWHRVPLLLELFESSRSEWIFWSDIDSLIMRYDVRLEWMLDPSEAIDLVIPNQGSGFYLDELVPDCLCFGQFFLRNSHWSRRFLEEIWNWIELPGMDVYREKQSWEQEAVNYIYRNNLVDFNRHAKIMPNRCFNSFFPTQYRRGDFLVHFAGDEARKEGQREKLIEEFAARQRNTAVSVTAGTG